MKILKIIGFFLALGLFLEIYAYYNLQVSYKYEVELSDSGIKIDAGATNSEKLEKIHDRQIRKAEILDQQALNRTLLLLLSIGVVTVGYLYCRKRALEINEESKS
ncbi:MAG: hypothetical protein V4594_00570 [Bacteroidota bacterium]